MTTRGFPGAHEPGGAQAKLALLFLLLGGVLTALVGGYWLAVLEPRLESDAHTHARILAQSQAHAIARELESGQPDAGVRLERLLAELSILSDPATGTAYLRGVELELDPEVVTGMALVQSFGDSECPGCFVTEVPLYSDTGHQLLGLARFFASPAFLDDLRGSVRLKLLAVLGVFLLLLAIIWRSVGSLLRQIRTSEDNLRRVFEAVPFPMALTRPVAGVVLHANRAAAELFDAEGGRLEGLESERLYARPGDRERVMAELHRHRQLRDMELELRDAAGRHRWVMLSAQPLELAGSEALVVGLADVSRLKQAHHELRRAKEMAEEATRTKSEFLANMSHEIRTPMNGVLGLAHMLLRTDMDERQRGYAEAMLHSAESLLAIIDDVLDFSKLEAGRMAIAPVPCSLPALAEEVVRLMTPRAKEKGLALLQHVDGRLPAYVMCDPARVRQILTNLLGNAVKFTEQGYVALVMECDARNGDRLLLRIRVEDTGIGIESDRVKAIFEKFDQGGRGTARRYGGTGLGLAISRELTYLMGGELSVESEPGRGSAFIVELPMRATEAPPEVLQPSQGAPDGSGLHVLLVDDHRINRMVAAAYLEEIGCAYDSAEDGERALELLRARRYDLVLMDVRLPGLDGLEVTRILREEEGRARHTPVVAMTASALPEDRRRCLASGMDDFLTKPLRPEALYAVFERFCSPLSGTEPGSGERPQAGGAAAP